MILKYDEDRIEEMFWEFDERQKRTGDIRGAFKLALRSIVHHEINRVKAKIDKQFLRQDDKQALGLESKIIFKKHYGKTIEEIIDEYFMDTDGPGLCLNCNEVVDGIEHDMECGWCPHCDSNDVKSIFVLMDLWKGVL